MIIALDANILVGLFTDTQIFFALKQYSKKHNVQQTIIPSPAYCEFLSHDSSERLAYVQQKFKRSVTIQSFDEKAAILTAKLAEKYNVSSVPKIIINDKYEFLGNQPIETFLNEIDKL